MNNELLEIQGDGQSPCVGVCKMDQSLQLCSGCYRTIDEIIDWTILSLEEKRRVTRDIEDRKASRNNKI